MGDGDVGESEGARLPFFGAPQFYSALEGPISYFFSYFSIFFYLSEGLI
jgi:hypothetical protein